MTWSLTARIITRKKISTKDGYLFLAGRHKIINSRESNQQESVYKTAIAVSAYKALSILPTIKFIGITGSLAMNNAKQDSDIDLMIITSPNTLWFSRLMSLLLLDIYGIKRRKAGDRQQKNKVCINIWLDELDLSWPKSKRNIYTAHEIAQIKSVLNRSQTYKKFINANSWVKRYWPNAIKTDAKILSNKDIKNDFMNDLISLLNNLAFRLQYLYMKPKITNETITSTRALFHPRDWSQNIARKLKHFQIDH